MHTINCDIINAIGKQIEPRATSMTNYELETFEKMCTDIARSESLAVASIENTKVVGVLKEAYEVAVANCRNEDAAKILDKLIHFV